MDNLKYIFVACMRDISNIIVIIIINSIDYYCISIKKNYCKYKPKMKYLEKLINFLCSL